MSSDSEQVMWLAVLMQRSIAMDASDARAQHQEMIRYDRCFLILVVRL